ncbi:MAG: penicillin-binding transpeptidase domain-containing protein, partial [Lachnospiraceae bacterium]
DNKGAVIVSDVKTGAILCMVSKPDFDPNTIVDNWDSLLSDSTSGTLVNRVSQGLYAPGSTFKIFDSIAFMDQNMSGSESYTFPCQGYITIDGETITDYHYEVHGTLDFQGSFAESCNSSFANIVVNELNRTDFIDLLNNCMFGEDLPFALPSNQSSYVLDSGTSTKEVMQLAIGQGQTLMTPLHLNMITAAIANGGTVYTPYVVDSIRTAKTTQNPDGRVLTQTEPTAYRTIMSEDVASKMREMMRAVVEYGTGTKIRERSYNAAGKTGSAEYLSNETTSHAWFTGFAPYDDPQVAITVIVEGGGTGGTAAVPIARDVLDEYFGYTGSTEDQQVTWYTTDNTIAPASTSDDEDLSTANTISLNMDTNGDGVLDAVDIDGDGVADVYDTDGDGIPDTQAIDGQAPAIVTPDEASSAASSDEAASTTDTTGWVDTDGDGVADTPAEEAAAVQAAEAAAAASSTTTDAAAAASTTTDAAAAASSTTTDAAAAASSAADATQQTGTADQTPAVTDPNQAPAAGDGTAQDAAAAAQAEALPAQ